jgi:hypothetical protein
MAGGRPEACEKQVRQSLNRDEPRRANVEALTSDLHGGFGTTLTQRALMEHQWRAGLLAAARRRKRNVKCNQSQASFLRHCPASEAVGVLTMRCSPYEGCQLEVRRVPEFFS